MRDKYLKCQSQVNRTTLHKHSVRPHIQQRYIIGHRNLPLRMMSNYSPKSKLNT